MKENIMRFGINCSFLLEQGLLYKDINMLSEKKIMIEYGGKQFEGKIVGVADPGLEVNYYQTEFIVEYGDSTLERWPIGKLFIESDVYIY